MSTDAPGTGAPTHTPPQVAAVQRDSRSTGPRRPDDACPSGIAGSNGSPFRTERDNVDAWPDPEFAPATPCPTPHAPRPTDFLPGDIVRCVDSEPGQLEAGGRYIIAETRPHLGEETPDVQMVMLDALPGDWWASGRFELVERGKTRDAGSGTRGAGKIDHDAISRWLAEFDRRREDEVHRTLDEIEDLGYEDDERIGLALGSVQIRRCCKSHKGPFPHRKGCKHRTQESTEQVADTDTEGAGAPGAAAPSSPGADPELTDQEMAERFGKTPAEVIAEYEEHQRTLQDLCGSEGDRHVFGLPKTCQSPDRAAGRVMRRVWLNEQLEKLSDRDIADGLFGAIYAEMDVTGLAGELVDQAVKRLRRSGGGAIEGVVVSRFSSEKAVLQ